MQLNKIITLASFFVFACSAAFTQKVDTTYINTINQLSFDLRESNPD